MLHGRAPWVPDEVLTAGRENLDPEHVARYDAKEDADAASEVTRLVAAGLAERPTVVDLGAGTGQFSLAMAARAERVIAVDVSPAMLDRLSDKAGALAVGSIEVVEAGFLTYQHAGEPADLVYSRYALHHLPDFWKAVALDRIAGMLRPGGILRLVDVVYSFELHETQQVLEAWMDGYASESVEVGWTRSELEDHVRDEHSTFTWLLEAMLTHAGFTIETAEYSDDKIFAAYLCRRSH